jgi:hypothetical protein
MGPPTPPHFDPTFADKARKENSKKIFLEGTCTSLVACCILEQAATIDHPKHIHRTSAVCCLYPLISLYPLIRHSWVVSCGLLVQDCAFIARDDGRWRTGSCTMAGPTACRLQNGTWLLQDGDRGACPEGSSFAVPSHSKENTALQMRLQNSSFGAAWLPLQGTSLKPTVLIDTCCSSFWHCSKDGGCRTKRGR